MATAAAAYEGGTGGKFRKRPLRRPPATPYDRPPSAARGLRVLPAIAVEKNGWLSKFVDPASRIIARSASRLFSSVFRKRLAAPPAASEENLQASQEVPAVVCTNPSFEVREQGGSDAENIINNSNIDEDQQKTNSDNGGIFELEQLLRQKTFTKVEFDRLTKLLFSRTIEPSTLQPAISCEKKEKANVSNSIQENGTGCIGSNVNNSNPAVKQTIPGEEIASPAELAKSYMGSRPSKVASSTPSFRNQIFREETALPSNVLYEKKGSNLSIAPRSVAHFSGISEVPENGYITPRPIGRSAMHRMSCSPYFKAPSTINIKGGEPYRDSYAGPSKSSQWTPTNFMQPGGKQVHKRGSSVLDDDFGSSGPIRRIRQKSNLVSASKDIHSLLPGNAPSTPSTPPAKYINQGSAASIQNPLCLNGPRDGTADLHFAENGGNKVPLASIPIPLRSIEMERTTLQQLDKPVSSPKGKSSKPRAIARDELPSKLTVNMLHERALRSMEDIDSSKFFNLQGSGNLDAPSDSNVPTLGSNISRKQLSVEDNIPPKPVFSGVMTSETIGMVNSVISVTDAEPGLRTADSTISGSAVILSPKKPAFQMTAPEYALELDDDDYIIRDTSDPFTIGNDKLEPKMSDSKTFISETAILEKSLVSSSERVRTSGSRLSREADMKASNGPLAGKDTGFSFHVAPAPCTFSQPPSTPTMPSPLLDRTAPQKEQIAAPGFIFGSKESQASVLPTATTRISDSAGLKFNASNATTTALLEGSNSDKGGKSLMVREILSSSGNVASSGLSTLTSPAVASFGASTTPNLSNGSNGSQTSTSFTFSVSAVAAVPFSNNSVASTFSTSTAATTCSSSPSFSSVPLFPTVPSGASTAVPISISVSMDKSNSTELEGMPVKTSPFSTSSAIALGTSASFSNTGSNSSSVLATSSVPSSMISSSSVATSLFSSSGSGSSALSVSSTSSNTCNDIFGFSAPAQSSSSSLSIANINSENSTTTIDATAGSTFVTEATQAGNGISQFSQATASQFGSFTSSPAFELSGSSSLGSGSSPFGSVTPGPKPFGSSTGLSFPTGIGSSSSASASSFAPTATTSLFNFSSQTSTSPIFCSSTFSPSRGFSIGQSAPTSSSQPSTSIFGASTSLPSTGFSFGQSAPISTSQPPSSSVFGSSTSSLSTGLSVGQSAPVSSSQPSSSSAFGSSTSSSTGLFSFGQAPPTSSAQPSTLSIFGSCTSSTTKGFSFGQSAPSLGSSPFTFGASSGSAFSFTSAGTTSSSALPSPAQPVFGLPTPAAGFSSGSPGNDQMNVEDSMADETIQAAAPVVPTFGQPVNQLVTQKFTFGSPAVPSGAPSAFQFASQQNSSVPQTSSSFQPGGNLEFSAGGSFSLGSVGGDKSGRKMVKINRNKHRKK